MSCYYFLGPCNIPSRGRKPGRPKGGVTVERAVEKRREERETGRKSMEGDRRTSTLG